MRPHTKDRITRAIDELGFTPNRAARALRTGQTTLIGLLVPSVDNPFWGSFARAIEAEAVVQGRQVLLGNTERIAEREARYVEELRTNGVRSVVVGSSLPDLRHLAPALAHGTRVIAFDRESRPSDPAGLISVSVDNVVGAQMATQHLIDLGHRRIAFLSGRIATISRQGRYAGYRQALDRAGIRYRQELVWTNPSAGFGDVESGNLAEVGMQDLLGLEQPPTAVVAINDLWALGACAAIRAAGKKVPDISIVGFDDIPISRLANPPLTTVRQPLPEMARLVVDALNAADGAATRSTVVAPELIVRGSSSRRPHTVRRTA